jgi:hypothetical protein
MTEFWLVTVPNRGRQPDEVVRALGHAVMRNSMSGTASQLAFDCISGLFTPFYASDLVYFWGRLSRNVCAGPARVHRGHARLADGKETLYVFARVGFAVWFMFLGLVCVGNQTLSEEMPKLNSMVEVSSLCVWGAEWRIDVCCVVVVLSAGTSAWWLVEHGAQAREAVRGYGRQGRRSAPRKRQ